MKTPEVGQAVQHFRDPEAEPAAAIVTEVNESNGRCQLALLLPGMQNLMVVDAVPHLHENQKGHTRPIDEEIGFWDWLPTGNKPKLRGSKPATVSA